MVSYLMYLSSTCLCNSALGFVFVLVFILGFIYLFEAWDWEVGRGRHKGRGKENLEQTPCLAWSPMWGLDFTMLR